MMFFDHLLCDLFRMQELKALKSNLLNFCSKQGLIFLSRACESISHYVGWSVDLSSMCTYFGLGSDARGRGSEWREVI